MKEHEMSQPRGDHDLTSVVLEPSLVHRYAVQQLHIVATPGINTVAGPEPKPRERVLPHIFEHKLANPRACTILNSLFTSKRPEAIQMCVYTANDCSLWRELWEIWCSRP